MPNSMDRKGPKAVLSGERVPKGFRKGTFRCPKGSLSEGPKDTLSECIRIANARALGIDARALRQVFPSWHEKVQYPQHTHTTGGNKWAPCGPVWPRVGNGMSGLDAEGRKKG